MAKTTGYRKPPSISDHSWASVSKPLLGFLQEARTWTDLSGWSRREDLTRHCLAWLENQGEIRSFYRDEKLFWIATDLRRAHVPSKHRSSDNGHEHGQFRPVDSKPRHLVLPTPIALPTVIEATDDAVPLKDADDVSLRDTGSDG